MKLGVQTLIIDSALQQLGLPLSQPKTLVQRAYDTYLANLHLFQSASLIRPSPATDHQADCFHTPAPPFHLESSWREHYPHSHSPIQTGRFACRSKIYLEYCVTYAANPVQQSQRITEHTDPGFHPDEFLQKTPHYL